MTTVAEYLLRVRPCADGYTATLRRFEPTPHAEVRAIVGPVSTGAGANVPAAMVAAISNAHIPVIPAERARPGFRC
jgi:hypothetical protein